MDTEAGGAVEFGHDPLESLRESRLELTARVRIHDGEREAAVLRGGGVARLLPDRIELETHAGHAPFVHAVDMTKWREVRLALDAGAASVAVDGEVVLHGPIGEDATPRARVVAFGNLPVDSRTTYRYTGNRGKSEWSGVKIRTHNPTLPGVDWEWRGEGPPDREELASVTVLEEETSGEVFEHGYTGWTAISDEEVFVVNYIRGDAPKPYIVGYRLGV